MPINKITNETKRKILNKTAYSLPDNPSDVGMTPAQIKECFYRGILDSENAITSEIDRIVDETNACLGQKADKYIVSSELTLYASDWDSETKTQRVTYDIDNTAINEITVMGDSVENWYANGVYAIREIPKSVNPSAYGVVFYSKFLPTTNLKFKIVSLKLEEGIC